MPFRRVTYVGNQSPFWSWTGSLLTEVIAVIISLPLYIPIVLVLPIVASIRWVLFKLYRRRSDQNHEPERMSGPEERWMMSRGAVMHAVLVIDSSSEPLSLDQFRRILSTRVLPLYPRLTRLPVALPSSAGARYCWLPDSQFSISRHVYQGPPSICSRKLAQSYVAQLMQEVISSDKPPWEFHLIYPRGKLRDTLIIARVHQSIGDGSELLRVLCQSLVDTPSTDIPERPQFRSLSFGLNVLRGVLTGPCTLLVWRWLTTTDSNPISPRSDFSGQVTLTWSAKVTLPKVMRIKQVTRSTVNCVVLSALAGAVRVLLQGCGIVQPPNVKVLVPIDIRSQSRNKANSTRLGNKSTTTSVTLPVSVEGSVPRLWATRRTLSSLNTSTDPVLLYMATAALMTMASPAASSSFLDLLANKTTIQYSNISGPTSYLSIAGGRLDELYCLTPTIGSIGISVTCVTYADQVLLSVVAKNDLGQAAQILLSHIQHQIEVLWKLLLHRRVPGENTICATPYTPEMIHSPMQQIEERILEIQKEVARINVRKQDGEFQALKIEYSQLVGELKRRLSDGTCRPSRVRSSSLTSRLSAFSLRNVLSPRCSTHSLSPDSIDIEGQNDKHANRMNVESGNVHKNKPQYTLSPKTETHHLFSSKHRKNSFEFMRFQNKQKEYQRNHKIVMTTKTEQYDSESEDMVADYSDDPIRISDDECMDAVTGPINPTLRDLYCSNYLEHTLERLKKQQHVLEQQLPGKKPVEDQADSEPGMGLLI